MTEITGALPAAGELVITPDDHSDEGFVESSSASLLSTVPSEVTRLREEHGRLFASYGKNPYGMPVDDDELDRLDLNHYKYTMIQGDRLFLAPVEDARMILDLGTGTGIWAIEVADKLPAATVIGTDIAPVQPDWIPPNASFQIDDVEDDWTFAAEHFDYIHCRDFLQSIRDWPRLVNQTYRALKPGGWAEFSGVYPVPHSDDDSIAPDSAYAEVLSTFQEIQKTLTREPDAPVKWKGWFEHIGLEDVVERVFVIPCSPWAKNSKLKKIGAFELMNVLQGAQGFLIKGYTETMGKSREELEMLLYRMRKELLAGKTHAYIYYYVVYGRKPATRPA